MADIIYTDRSRYECGQRCDRERFWNYHYEGDEEILEQEEITQVVPGVVPQSDSLDLLFGLAVHEHVERCQTGNGKLPHESTIMGLWNAESDTETPDGISVVEEYKALFIGLTSVFDKFTLPILKRDYDFMGAEVETMMDLGGGIRWMSRRDADLKRKSDGLWFTLEIKTSSYPEQLLTEASTNFQLLMEVESMRRHHRLRPEQCGGAMLLVFNKGRKLRASESERQRGKDGFRRISPFTYWYAKEQANGDTQYRLDYKSGWDRRVAWRVPGHQSVLFDNFEDEIKKEVQLYPSVSFDAQRVVSVIEQVKFKEQVYAKYQSTKHMRSALDWHFPQNFKMCNNSGGFKLECSYKKCCFSPSVASNPYVNGYEARKPNHPQETGEEK